ncbi:MAG TPA: protein kinase [Kofleriaceae bacterium]|nr:protein kinase [Kofleriaceae bacterium]
MTSDRFAPGARIGDYVVEREVAYEASAIVYFATHVVLPRQSHIKVTHPGSRAAAVQLLREACILEALSHPGVPRVHECGVLADRRPWSAIEVMPGIAFERFVGDGSIALSDVVVALRDLADILRHAHERGIVHRRLTARAVVRIQRRRSVYAIEDWADAKTHDAEAEAVVDARDDVHALGVIVFRALTGREPAPGESVATHCSAAPTELIAVIDQMLAEPVARPSADEIYDRALWLCDTLEASPLFERPRWTPPAGFVSEGISPSDSGGFAVKITRARTS